MPYYPLLAGFAVMLVSLSGVVFLSRRTRPWLDRNLRLLVAFSAGVFLVIVYSLFEEVLHEQGFSYTVVGSALLGAVVLELLGHLVPHAHHHHGPESHSHSPIDARRMLLGDAFHNVGDGLLIVPAFLISPIAGLATTGGIMLHELVQEISKFFVLREAGYSVRHALSLNFIVSSTIMVGIVASLFFSSVSAIEVPLLSFAGGGFLYLILRDFLPSVARHAKRERTWSKYLAALLLGALLMLAVSVLTPHTHEHVKELPLPDGFGLALR